jgi:predicted HTH transcriptional regulator
MKHTWIYDLEVFRKIFTATFIHKDTDETRVFVITIHDNKIIDDREELFSFLMNEVAGLVGYNNLHYDSQILEYFIKHPKSTTEELRAYSDLIINSENRFSERKYKKLCNQIGGEDSVEQKLQKIINQYGV